MLRASFRRRTWHRTGLPVPASLANKKASPAIHKKKRKQRWQSRSCFPGCVSLSVPDSSTWPRGPYIEIFQYQDRFEKESFRPHSENTGGLNGSTQREAKGISGTLPIKAAPKPMRVCRGCGAPIIYGKNFCSSCGVIVARDELIKSAKRGRIAAQSSEAQARRTETQRQNANAQLAWEKSGQTKISEEAYRNEIQPRLLGVTISAIMSALNVCASYAADIRRGRRRPHARHWHTLREIVYRATAD
jgi:hypothetical protein